MTLEATPIQPARDAGPSTPGSCQLPANATDRATRRASSPSTLTHCIAWLFGLEALFREPAERDKLQLQD